ncbi:hypothetical protein GGX14DRAFT_92813 [Mycena pura]|uniref:DUF6534 domain-containing protein n=1 Tax=Mycena pura TaxID=153505 RepID=A0AAD6VHA7_9AGAR|nr:hypothetical protein GGX14DRAFT_92813 [Mycena pura]
MTQSLQSLPGPAEIAHPAEITIGPLFVGFVFNVILCGTMFTQTYLYFTTFRRDKAWTKTFIVFILTLDTLNTIFDFAYLYDCLIIHFGDVSRLAHANWLFATDPIMTGIIASFVQMFYAWRVKVLTGNFWLVSLVVFCSLTGFAGGLECGHSLAVGVMPCRRSHNCYPRDPPKSHKTGLESSDILVDRIIRLTMQTGLATSLCATLDLILFLTDPIALHLIFNIPLCKLYTNSLLSSLNARKVQGPGSADSGSGTTLMMSKRSSMLPPSQNLYRSSELINVGDSASAISGVQVV